MNVNYDVKSDKILMELKITSNTNRIFSNNNIFCTFIYQKNWNFEKNFADNKGTKKIEIKILYSIHFQSKIWIERV